MSRKPVNSKAGLDRIAVLNGDSAAEYVRICEEQIGSVTSKPGVYSRSINDNGWANPSGLRGVKTQGLVKSMAWTIRDIKRRAEEGDAEAQIVVQNLEAIIKKSAD